MALKANLKSGSLFFSSLALVLLAACNNSSGNQANATFNPTPPQVSPPSTTTAIVSPTPAAGTSATPAPVSSSTPAPSASATPTPTSTPTLSTPTPSPTPVAITPAGYPSCLSSDSNHYCLGMKVVSFKDANSVPSIDEINTLTMISQMNTVWGQCNIGFQLESFVEVNPGDYNLAFNSNWRSDGDTIRSTFPGQNQFLLVAVGTLSGSTIAVTEMPGAGVYGTLVEKAYATNPLTVGHEYGHYMGLYHISDSSNLMNPYIGANTRALNASQCATARSTVQSSWPAMKRQ